MNFLGSLRSWKWQKNVINNHENVLQSLLFNLQADVKIPGLPLKVVMEAIQQATGELKWQWHGTDFTLKNQLIC